MNRVCTSSRHCAFFADHAPFRLRDPRVDPEINDRFILSSYDNDEFLSYCFKSGDPISFMVVGKMHRFLDNHVAIELIGETKTERGKINTPLDAYRSRFKYSVVTYVGGYSV